MFLRSRVGLPAPHSAHRALDPDGAHHGLPPAFDPHVDTLTSSSERGSGPILRLLPRFMPARQPGHGGLRGTASGPSVFPGDLCCVLRGPFRQALSGGRVRVRDLDVPAAHGAVPGLPADVARAVVGGALLAVRRDVASVPLAAWAEAPGTDAHRRHVRRAAHRLAGRVERRVPEAPCEEDRPRRRREKARSQRRPPGGPGLRPAGTRPRRSQDRSQGDLRPDRKSRRGRPEGRRPRPAGFRGGTIGIGPLRALPAGPDLRPRLPRP